MMLWSKYNQVFLPIAYTKVTVREHSGKGHGQADIQELSSGDDLDFAHFPGHCTRPESIRAQ